MKRSKMAKAAKLALLSLALAVSCRPHHERPKSQGGPPTWSFGIPRGVSSDGRSPIQLTASDGTGLKLVSLDAKVAMQGPLAFTELTMGFENPLDRVLEGHFDVVLPSGAAVNRFAMHQSTGWQEAEMVEKQAAREAYEDFLHRKQDPALLEKAAGNEFSARVFPIAPRAVKQIKLSYAQELPSTDEPYRLPLRGLPLLPALQIVVYAEETLVKVAKEQFTADGDFLLERPGASSGLQSGKLIVARLRPPLPASPSPMAGVTILFDTSASRTPGFVNNVAELGVFIEQLRKVHGEALPLRVAAFDQDVAPLYTGTAGGFAHDAKSILDGLISRGALGASDVAGALAWAARTDASHQRLVLITDGVATASASMVSDKIEEAGDDAIAMGRAADLLKPRFDRLDVILVGGIRDDAAMRALTTHHLTEDGAILDGAEGAERLVKRLDEATRSGVRVSVDGAAWVWPTHVDGMQRGDDLVVYAEMSSDKERDTVKVELAGPVSLATDVPLASPENAGLRPLVERAWARARIESLGTEARALPPAEHDQAARLRKEIVNLSTRYRVLSDYTSLLVLESESDYARFHIDRHALTDILVVDDQGLHLMLRRDAVIADDEAKLRDLERQVEQLKEGLKKEKARLDVMSSPAQTTVEVDKPAEKVAASDGERRARVQEAVAARGVLAILGAGKGGGGTGAAHNDPMGTFEEMPAADHNSGGEEGRMGERTPAHASPRPSSPSPVAAAPPPMADTAVAAPRMMHLEPSAPRAEPKPRRESRHHDHAVEADDIVSVDGSAISDVFNSVGGVGVADGVLSRRGAGGSGGGHGIGGLRANVPSSTVTPSGAPVVSGSVDASQIAAVMHGHSAQLRYVYERRLQFNPSLAGRLVLTVFVDKDGKPTQVTVSDSTMYDRDLETGLDHAVRGFRFPAGAPFSFRYPLVFSGSGYIASGPTPPEDRGAPSWTGKMLDIMTLVADKKLDEARTQALAWHASEPGDVLALVALGNVGKAAGQPADAARAYGSIIDLFPARADLRRFAGDLLESLGAAGEPLAADSFAHAVRDRADHPNSHRLRAYSLLRAGHPAEAFAAIEAGAARTYPSGRFLGVDRILREDAGLIAAAWLHAEPKRRDEVVKRLDKLGAALPTGSSLRFVLSWETDANDVDFHIRDKDENRAWFSNKHLASGGDLYADVTTGYGPECFTIEGAPTAFPYHIQAHYYSRGPMGYGMGKVEIIQHDGAGGLVFEERPFVVMNDQAFVDLGAVEGPLAAKK